MEYPKVLFSSLKSLRQQRQWSQESLAEMTGLSVRTIQRIEQGHKASLESTKALNAIFELQFVDVIPELVENSNNLSKDLEKQKQAYSKEVKEFLNLCTVAGICILSSFVIGITNQSWKVLGWTVFCWVIVLAFKGATTFNFIGDSIKDELMKKKFKNNKTHD